MTKQKFYEMCIVRTYLEALDEPKHVLHNEAELIRDKLTENITFDELQLVRALAGFDPNVFPATQPFDKLGAPYLLQIMSFVYSLEDSALVDALFSMLNSNSSLVNFADKDVAAAMYNFFYDGICGSYYRREFSQKMGAFFLRNGKTAWELHGKVLTVLYALGDNLDGMTLSELVEMKREHEEKDGYCTRPIKPNKSSVPARSAKKAKKAKK